MAIIIQRKFLLIIILWLVVLSGMSAYAQVVVIPRDGFPYCEPFTGSSTRANTEYGGTAILTSGNGDPVGNGVLQLTNNGNDETGYIYVDLPFSSTYGIKTSFEYFAYGPATPGDPGDGFSFFLFDGALGPNPGPNLFEIGGLGGSLGYSPLRYSGGNFGGGYGLKGAYMGIGLDERGNWGNQYEGRYGGFEDPAQYGSGLSPTMFPRYPNSIAIRGPINPGDVNRDNGMDGNYTGFPALFPSPPLYGSYQFIDGKIVNNNQSDGAPFDVLAPNYFLPPSQQFTIGASSRATDCSIDGYRKVFIDLKPNGAGSFTITMDMLINSGSGPRIVNIFNNVPYPYPAPQNLKVGFAAATGASLRSIHEIRNATVEVSSIDPALAPNPPILDASVCFEDDLTFDFEVSLPAQNSFIRCLQLYPTNPGDPDNSPNPNGNPTLTNGNPNCGISGVCEEKCLPENKLITVSGVGVFEAILGELTEGNFDDERNNAEIKFTPEPGFFGTHTIYYTVLDNYGLTSLPKTVTVTVNPFPKIDDDGAIIGPTCNGQNDGSIENVVLKDLVAGYTFTWKDEFGNVLPAANYSKTEVAVGAYFEATVGVTGVNLGNYYLTVNNPATNSVCDDIFEFKVEEERGSPVKVVLNDQEVCEGTPVEFSPELEDLTDASNPQYVWWKDNAKTEQITNGMTAGAATYNLTGAGILTITGLAQSATPYEYYVEVKADPSQNLCATPAGQLKRVQVLVLPPLDIQLSKTEDLCRQSAGEIVITATGGFPTKTYSIDGITFVSSNTFSNLLPGDYTVYVSAGTNCIGQKDITIEGPAEVLSINQLSQENPSCATDNGIITFEVAGGTTPSYTFTLDGAAVTPTLAAGIYTISGIAPATTHTVAVADANNCPASFTSQNFDATPIPVFAITDDEICPSEAAVITVDESGKSNATNIAYNWTNADGTPLVNGNGVTYTENSITGELIITGLTEDQLTYEYALQVTGDNICTQTPKIATVTITPTPEVEDPVIDHVSCFGGSDGTISLNATDPATAGNYEYSIDGGVNYKDSGLFSGLLANTYTVRVRSKIGSQCYRDISGLTVGEPTALVVSGTPTDPTCGNANGEISVTVSGGTPDYTVDLLLNGALLKSLPYSNAAVTFTELAPGDYSVSVIDENSCQITDPVTLTNDPGFEFTIEPMADEICFGQIASIVPVFNTNGSPTITWYKDAAGTDPVISSPTPDGNGIITLVDNTDYSLSVEGLPVGISSYFLGVSGSGYCPYPLFEAEVTVLEPLEATPIITNEICFQAADGSITVNAIGGDGNYTYSLNGAPFVSSNIFTNLAKGSYIIDVQSSNGCDFQLTATVDGPVAPITTNSPDIIRESCNLGNGIIENLVISGGWGNYTVEWRSGSETGPVVPGDETGTSDLIPDTYFLIVIDDSGCREVFNYVVDAQPLPDYQITQAMDECEGVPISFTPINIVPGSSPTEVKWYKGPGQTNEILNGPDPANPAIVYSIDDTDWVNPTLEITGLPAGTYTYYFYVVCTGQEIAVDVEIFPIPAVVLNSTPVTCFGAGDGKILVNSGGSPTQRYFVDNGSALTQAELEAMTFGPKIYNIRVEQAGVGCPANFQIEVLGPDSQLQVEPLIAIQPGCGADIGIIRSQITGGWAPYEVTLYKNGTALNTQSITVSDYEAINLAPGDYYLSIVDGEGCIITSDTITLIYGPTQVLVDDIEICESESAVLKPTLNPAASGATFEWFRGPGATNPIISSTTPDSNGHTFEIASDGTLTVIGLNSTDSPFKYYVRANGGGICPGGFAEPAVAVFDQPTVTATVQEEICFGENGTITLTGAGGSGTYEYSLDGSAFQSSSQFTAAPGSHTATVRSGGCENTLSGIIVTGPPAPISNSEPTISNPTCGQANGVIQFTIAGGYGSYSVESFKDGSSLGAPVSSTGDFELTNLLAGDYNFIIVDGKGCLYPMDSPITLEDGLTPLSAPDQEICEGEVASITPTSSQIGISPTFTWYQNSDGTGQITSETTAGISYQVAANGTLNVTGLAGKDTPYTYYVEISGPGTCPPPLVAVDVMVYPIPNLRVSNPSIVCDPTGTVDLTDYIEGFNSAIYDYQIESPNGDDMRMDEILSVNQSGSYIVQSSVKGANCWTPTQRILVKIAATELVPEFNYQFDLGGGNILVNTAVQILEPVDFLDNSLGDVVIWNWDFGDGTNSSEQNPTHTFDSKGIFTVTLTTIDSIGCVGTYQRVIEVRDDYMIIVPNAFTPTGAKNVFFKPKFRGISSMDFYVFNTWGELIFEANSLETLGWDGTWKGKDTPNGNYVYKAIFTTRSGQKVEKAGVFILIR